MFVHAECGYSREQGYHSNHTNSSPQSFLKFSALFGWPDGLDLTEIKISGNFLPGKNNTPDVILCCLLLSQKNKDNLHQFTEYLRIFIPFRKTKV